MHNQNLLVQKKKRTSTSNSRSKSRKSTLLQKDLTIQLKPKALHIFQNVDICSKVKTQNSLSLNKSKQNRKPSKSLKRPSNPTSSKHKDQSYLVSVERKSSINKINKTQTTHVQSQDVVKKIYAVKKVLENTRIKKDASIEQIISYFHQLKQQLINISIEPMTTVFQMLHNLYVTPIQSIFDLVRPYQQLLRKKQQISKLIKIQQQQNQALYKQLDPEDILIIELKRKIQQNAQRLQQVRRKKKSSKKQQNQGLIKKQQNNFMKKKKQNKQNTSIQQGPRFLQVSSQYQKVIQPRSNNFQRKLIQQYQKRPKFLQDIHSQSKGNLPVQNNQISPIYPQKTNSPINNEKQHQNNFQDIYLEQPQKQQQKGTKSGGMSFNFKLDIPKIDKSNVGFHQEFYSKLDQFSQSWRNQALREKRF